MSFKSESILNYFIPSSKIKYISFDILSSDDIRQKSVVEIDTAQTHLADNTPAEHGLYDHHTGVLEYKECATCGNRKKDCPGHSGVYELTHPLPNPHFYKEIFKWLKSVCSICSGTYILNKNVKNSEITNIKINTLNFKAYEKYIKNVTDPSLLECSRCHALMKRTYRNHIDSTPHTYSYIDKVFTKKNKKDSNEFFDNKSIDILYSQILTIFEKFREEDVIRLNTQHPTKYLMDCIYVPPLPIRPEMKKIGSTRAMASDCTSILKNIINSDKKIPTQSITEGQQIDSKVKQMQLMVAGQYYQMICSGGKVQAQSSMKGKPPNSLASRIPKKTGRIRSNLLSKRVKKMCRSVVTGDLATRLDEVQIPQRIASELTIGEKVHKMNYAKMEVLYKNGGSKYPGCLKIQKKDGTLWTTINGPLPNYTLQLGDMVFRNLMDGDMIAINREPSILPTAIASLTVRITDKYTIGFNPSICPLFNADFDGDEMNGICIESLEGKAEMKFLNRIDNWLIDYQTSNPFMGLYQDSIIGIYKFTNKKVNKINKFHAMQMFGRVIKEYPIVFSENKGDEFYTSHALISKVLPEINYVGTANFKNPLTEKYFDATEEDWKVKIERGKYMSGVLDKAAIGDDANGGLFHIVYSEFGAKRSIDTIYALQQLINNYLFYESVTIGLRDVLLNKETENKLELENKKIIKKSIFIFDQLKAGKLKPPNNEMTINEYYEQKQEHELQQGDDFIIHVVADPNMQTSSFPEFIFSGSKGKLSNFKSICAQIGNIGKKGGRMPESYNGRTTCNFTRSSSDPIARGYCPDSFRTGINPQTFLFSCIESRFELLDVALSTALAGKLSRDAVKTLESVIVSNYHSTVKCDNKLIQIITAENGFDPRKTEIVEIETIKISDSDFSKYHIKNTKYQKELDKEFEDLTNDRNTFRNIHFKLEQAHRTTFFFNSSYKSPFNIEREIQNILALYKDKKRDNLNIKEALEAINECITNTRFMYSNDIQRRKYKDGVLDVFSTYFNSEPWIAATTFMNIYIRSRLNIKNLLEHGIDNNMLDYIIQKIENKMNECLFAYGTCIGIIAGQCMSEPMMQYFLDAKHRSGLKKEKTNKYIRFEELLKNKVTENMHNPEMIIIPDTDRYTKNITQKLAYKIEMLKFERLIESNVILFEAIPTDLDTSFKKFSEDNQHIQKFKKHHITTVNFDRLLPWCIRYTIQKINIFSKSLDIQTITRNMEDQLDIIVIYFDNPLNNQEYVLRVYLKQSIFKKDQENIFESIKLINEKIKQFIVNGIKNIKAAYVIPIMNTEVDTDGSIIRKDIYAIETTGDNLEQILVTPGVDPYNTTTNSVTEIEYMFGIDAASNKLREEFAKVEKGIIPEWVSLYVDEMTSTYMITNMQKSGLAKRENNTLLQASYGNPIGAFKAAAMTKKKNDINGISAPLCMGEIPRFGTTYNDIIVDYVKMKNIKNNKVIDEFDSKINQADDIEF